MDSVPIVTVRIRRQDPAASTPEVWQEYPVPRTRARRVLDVLEYIQEEVDPTLAFRPHLCRDLCCGVCWIQVNGHDRMACSTPIAEGTQALTLEPVSGYPLIRDLAVDFSRPLGKKRLSAGVEA